MAPRLIVIAGCNGAGKSTLSRRLRDPTLPVINPDEYAFTHHLHPVSAGRRALRRIKELFAQKQSFAIETTLSGKSIFNILRTAQDNGYFIHLRYIVLPSPELAVMRVRQRVALGGHDVPETDVIRRYHRSLANLPQALALAHEVRVYDNGGRQMLPVLDVFNGKVKLYVDVRRPRHARMKEVLDAFSRLA